MLGYLATSLAAYRSGTRIHDARKKKKIALDIGIGIVIWKYHTVNSQKPEFAVPKMENETLQIRFCNSQLRNP